VNVMGWIGFALSTLALVLNARRRRLAQVVFIAGNLMWLAWAIHQRLPEMMASQVTYLILNIRILLAWMNENRSGLSVPQVYETTPQMAFVCAFVSRDTAR